MAFDDSECLAEFRHRRGMIDGEQRPQQAPVDLGVEDGYLLEQRLGGRGSTG